MVVKSSQRYPTRLLVAVLLLERTKAILDGGAVPLYWDASLVLTWAGLVVILYGIASLGSFDTWVGLVLEFRVRCRHGGSV